MYDGHDDRAVLLIAAVLAASCIECWSDPWWTAFHPPKRMDSQSAGKESKSMFSLNRDSVLHRYGRGSILPAEIAVLDQKIELIS